jgi:radical SAM superfamily enzyme YgiQ (UPF0313 family)
VWIGAESGSQKILDAMDKGITVAQILNSVTLLKKAGIKACMFLQFGYPGETWEDILRTIDMLTICQPHDIGVSVSYPLPGTGFYEKVKSQLSEKQNWTDSDELLPMYSSTYPPEFYRRLQRFVHYGFRKRQALALFRYLKLNTRVALLPYYIVREKKFLRELKQIDPSVKDR